MKIQTTGTIQDGMIYLDHLVDIPNKSRVTVNLERIPFKTKDTQQIFESFKELIQLHPVHSGGLHFVRDELYEND